VDSIACPPRVQIAAPWGLLADGSRGAGHPPPGHVGESGISIRGSGDPLAGFWNRWIDLVCPGPGFSAT